MLNLKYTRSPDTNYPPSSHGPTNYLYGFVRVGLFVSERAYLQRERLGKYGPKTRYDPCSYAGTRP